MARRPPPRRGPARGSSSRGSSSRRSSLSGGGSRRPAGGGGRSSSRGGRSSSRGGRGAPRGGGGSPATAIGVGVVLLIGVVILVVVAGGKDKKKPTGYVAEELTANSRVDKGTAGPTEKPKEPPPEISDAIISNAKAIVEQAREEDALGDELYNAAMDARRDGDEATWQAKLSEARDHYINIKDLWNNEIVAAIQDELDGMNYNGDYDADQVANHWIGKEAGKITKMLEKIGMITKQQRMKAK